MKKLTFLFVIMSITTFSLSAQWQAVNRAKAAGGEIPEKVNFMAIDNDKLYAATTDGIWESASMNGGDWAPFGLQGQEVLIMNFKDLKLAMVNTTSSEDTEQTAGQLYKLNGAIWELTKFNESRKSKYMATTGFAQIKDASNKQVIVIPTWGQGIWRSEDGGTTWTVSSQIEDQYFPDPDKPICKNTIALFTYDGDPVIYGTDKASASDHYLIKSFDYGKTWEAHWVGNVFNPWTFHRRMYSGVDTYYFGGEKGQDGSTVMKSVEKGVTETWTPCTTVDNSAAAIYWHNRCMVGKDNGPLFVMCAANNVYVSKDDAKTLEPLGTGLTITNANSRSLTHLVMTDDMLYCSSQEDGIQVFDISNISSIKENNYAELAVYPSVTEDYVFVKSDAATEISVYSVSGMLMLQQASLGGESKIDVSGLNNGLYIIQCKTNSVLSTNKIIKK